MSSKRLVLFVLLVVFIALMAVGMISCSDLSTRHTVSFYVQHGDEWSGYYAIRTRGNEILTYPKDPTKESFAFAGWYSDKLYTKEAHEYDYENTALEEDVTLYAKFVPASSITNPYSITFEPNKGSSVATQKVDFGGKVDGTKVTTERAGFEFDGWYIDADYTRKWNFTYDRVWKARTLYAKWISTGYTITYELNAEDAENSASNPAVFKFDTGLTLFDPTRLGYAFEGWFLDEEFETPYSNETLYDDNITVYAKWSEPLTYTIAQYELQSGETQVGDYPSSPYTVLDTPFNLPTLQKDGYDFVGWFIDEGKTEHFDKDKKYAQDMILYPDFQVHRYYFVYDLDGGVNAEGNPEDISYFDCPTTVTLNDPTKVGYSFLRWEEAEIFNAEFKSDVTVLPRDMSIDTITLHAVWGENSYDLTYHLPSGVTCAGITSGVAYPFMYEAQFTLKTPTNSDSSKYFAGWFLDSGFTRMYNSSTKYAEDVDVYPKYVDSELLIEENFYKFATTKALNIPKEQLESPNNKNLCIPLTEGKVVKTISINGSYIDSTDYIYDDSDIVVIKNSVFTSTYPLTDGDKYRMVITFQDDSSVVYYLTQFESGMYSATIEDYFKGTSDNLRIYFSSDDLEDYVVLNVSIDGYMVPYSISGKYILVSSDVIDLLSVDTHLLEIATVYGQCAFDFNVYNNAAFAPYSLKVDIDNDPGKVWVEWNYDFAATEYRVVITTNSVPVTYSSNDYPSLFKNNTFNATGLLTQANQKYKVVAVYNSTEYESNENTFKYNMTSSAVSKYINNSIEFLGKSMNTFVSSWEELYEIVLYMMLNWDELDAFNNSDRADYGSLYLCIDFDIQEAIDLGKIDDTSDLYSGISNMSLTNGVFVSRLIMELLDNNPESAAYSVLRSGAADGVIPGSVIETSSTAQTYKIGLKLNSPLVPTVNRTKENTGNGAYKDCTHFVSFQGSVVNDFETFPIENSNLGNVNVSTSVELYLALERGYNPIVSQVKYPDLYTLYNTIKTCLRGIVDETMTEYEQVLAIYQWLCTEVLYDYEGADLAVDLAKDYDDLRKIENPTPAQIEARDAAYAASCASYGWSCFYMEGVFNNRLAVCNGIAAAYSTMCNMLGIKCHKITGDVPTGGHAWNEVYVGGNWYISDATWGSSEVSETEILMYEYLFMTEKQATNTYNHIAKYTPYEVTYAQDNYINPYRIMKFDYSGTYDMVVSSNADFKRIYDYIVSKSGGIGNIPSGSVIVIQADTSLDLASVANLYSIIKNNYSITYIPGRLNLVWLVKN